MHASQSAQRRKIFYGQSTIEFTVTMVFAFILILGMIKVFAWTGRDLIDRRRAHDRILVEPLACEDAPCPLKQIRPDFYGVTAINAAVSSNMYGTN